MNKIKCGTDIRNVRPTTLVSFFSGPCNVPKFSEVGLGNWYFVNAVKILNQRASELAGALN